ncbi:hypothetical protein GCM10023314_22890 [Algibacter agarivorans]|uniref:Secretion system C-terminal sorting domain-containing protein n=1 Tax=Algibacter agarivorans TaxID=1109741 RepID=A0ABP9GNG5_9FLAO
MKEKIHMRPPSRLFRNLKNIVLTFALMAFCFVINAQNPNANENSHVDGGIILALDDTTVCVGDGVADLIDVQLTEASGRVKQWIITDDENNILELPEQPPFDFDSAPPGNCRIWHLSYNGIKPLVDPFWHKHVVNLSDLKGKYDLSNYIEVTKIQQPKGGYLEIEGGGTEIEICAGDGNSDAFNVTLTGAEGPDMLWVITDLDLNILATPDAPPFDLEGAGEGVCLIWNLSYAENVNLDGITNAGDITGCFDLSNPITVTRNGVHGGQIAIVGGATEIEICAGDGNSDAFDVTLSDDIMGDNSAWVITDPDLNILGLPSGPPFDLEGAGEGVCLIWHLSFEDGLTGAEVGMNAADLAGCFDLSNPITVARNGVHGGQIAIVGGATEIEICAGDGNSDAFDVTLSDDIMGDNSAWVITDTDLNILGLPSGPPFDLEGAGEGVCLIWHLSFEDGLTGAEVGMNAADLTGCFDLSNPITVIRNGVHGGVIEGGPFAFTIDEVADKIPNEAITLKDNIGDKSQWVITNEEATIILDLPNSYTDPDFNALGVGVCKVWHLSYADGLLGLEPPAEGDHLVASLSGCFSLSNAITVTRTAPVASKIGLFPNPSKEIVNVDLSEFGSKDVSVSVYSLLNVLIYSKDINSSDLGISKLVPLNISGYLDGIYFVSVKDAHTGYTVIKSLVVGK